LWWFGVVFVVCVVVRWWWWCAEVVVVVWWWWCLFLVTDDHFYRIRIVFPLQIGVVARVLLLVFVFLLICICVDVCFLVRRFGGLVWWWWWGGVVVVVISLRWWRWRVVVGVSFELSSFLFQIWLMFCTITNHADCLTFCVLGAGGPVILLRDRELVSFCNLVLTGLVFLWCTGGEVAFWFGSEVWWADHFWFEIGSQFFGSRLVLGFFRCSLSRLEVVRWWRLIEI